MSLEAKRCAARSGKMICPLCDKQGLLVEHHLHGRDIPGSQMAWNRCYICASCHDEVHKGMIVIEKWAQTSEGKKLMFRRAGEEAIVDEGAKPHLYGKTVKN
jgi:hypothetical protein